MPAEQRDKFLVGLRTVKCIRIMGAKFLMVTERSYERKKISTNPMVLETTW